MDEWMDGRMDDTSVNNAAETYAAALGILSNITVRFGVWKTDPRVQVKKFNGSQVGNRGELDVYDWKNPQGSPKGVPSESKYLVLSSYSLFIIYRTPGRMLLLSKRIYFLCWFCHLIKVESKAQVIGEAVRMELLHQACTNTLLDLE